MKPHHIQTLLTHKFHTNLSFILHCITKLSFYMINIHMCLVEEMIMLSFTNLSKNFSTDTRRRCYHQTAPLHADLKTFIGSNAMVWVCS